MTLTPPDPLPNAIDPILPEDVPNILSVSSSVNSIELVFLLILLWLCGVPCVVFSTPASVISFIASAAASRTTLEPSPVMISARSITSGGISQETPFEIEARAVIAVALILESPDIISLIIFSTSVVNSSYFNSLTLFQNFLTAKISPFLMGLRNWFRLLPLSIALNFLTPLGTLFLIIRFLEDIFLRIEAFLPDNSRTLKIRLPVFPECLGVILRPFLWAIRSLPLWTSNPTGGGNELDFCLSTIGGVLDISVLASSSTTTLLNISSRKSSLDIVELLFLSSLLSSSSPAETTKTNLLIFK